MKFISWKVAFFLTNSAAERNNRTVQFPVMWTHHVNKAQTEKPFSMLLFSVNQDIDSQHYMSVRETINASPQIFHTSVGSV